MIWAVFVEPPLQFYFATPNPGRAWPEQAMTGRAEQQTEQDSRASEISPTSQTSKAKTGRADQLI